jgi:hypothetical protein
MEGNGYKSDEERRLIDLIEIVGISNRMSLVIRSK